MTQSRKIFQLILPLFLLVGFIGNASAAIPPKNAVVQLPSQLAALAANAPDELERVIVYRADQTDLTDGVIQELGGTILKDLQLINAVAVQIPARSLPQLAKLAKRVSLDAPVVSTGKPLPGDLASEPVNTYLDTLDVRDVWAMGYTGAGIGVAVVDSGISVDNDLNVVAKSSFNPNSRTLSDVYGHGTHVAGIIAGRGADSDGRYQGVAPGVNLISLKISDESGLAYESDTVQALEWIYNNKSKYNIRVVNLSIQSTIEQSYHDSALNAAVEILWFNNVVVVAATGNYYGGGVYPLNAAPANDPFVITVGAIDEKGTSKNSDDQAATFSVWGNTQDGFSKPEIFAPGVNIISVLSKDSSWDDQYPERTVYNDQYFRISGTSMATPMVSGAVALLLQKEPNLTPNQVKYRIMHTYTWAGVSPSLNVYNMLTTKTTEKANQGIVPHTLLAKMAMIACWASQNGSESIDWANIDWSAVNWDAVDWSAVNWNAVNWNAVNWNAVNWNAVNWNAVNWNAVNWNAVNWNAVNWNAVNWNAVNWNAVNWNAVNW